MGNLLITPIYFVCYTDDTAYVCERDSIRDLQRDDIYSYDYLTLHRFCESVNANRALFLEIAKEYGVDTQITPKEYAMRLQKVRDFDEIHFLG